MEKITNSDSSEILKDVRTSYRLLALYQTRLKDVVKYVLDKYNLNFEAGYGKFSTAFKDGKGVKLENWSWDWLPMYLYQFSAQPIEKDSGQYFFHVFHQADTGFYDVFEDTRDPKRLRVAEFGSVQYAKTRLFFVLSKKKGWPYAEILHDNLSAKKHEDLIKENWIAKSFDMERFFNEEYTEDVLKNFDAFCLENFKINLLEN
tara:strand:+ start:12396 stop:13004 length:609 start_codon:yes stop_codon:yes gene_type:complete